MSKAETKEEIHLKPAAGASPPALSHPAPAIAAEPAEFFLSLLILLSHEVEGGFGTGLGLVGL